MNSRNLFKISKKGFCKYHFHHDFNPNHLAQATPTNTALAVFDFSRIIFYIAAGTCLIYNVPFYMAFRRSKFVDNPDYLLQEKKDK